MYAAAEGSGTWGSYQDNDISSGLTITSSGASVYHSLTWVAPTPLSGTNTFSTDGTVTTAAGNVSYNPGAYLGNGLAAASRSTATWPRSRSTIAHCRPLRTWQPESDSNKGTRSDDDGLRFEFLSKAQACAPTVDAHQGYPKTGTNIGQGPWV